MIKPSIRRAEAAIDLVAQGLGCGFVDFLAARQIIHVEEGVAEADVVDRVAVVVSQDLAGETGIQLDVDLQMTVGSMMDPRCFFSRLPIE
jgi:hypothetical protein